MAGRKFNTAVVLCHTVRACGSVMAGEPMLCMLPLNPRANPSVIPFPRGKRALMPLVAIPGSASLVPEH